MKKLILPRGISGSGKSTFAHEMQENFPETQIFSTDRKFYNENGEYIFNPKKLGEFHAENLSETCEAIRNKANLIIVDNTNLCVIDYIPYIREAQKHDYDIVGVSFIPREISSHFEKNIHNVPKNALHITHKKFHNESEKEVFQLICNEFYEISPENFLKDIHQAVQNILAK